MWYQRYSRLHKNHESTGDLDIGGFTELVKEAFDVDDKYWDKLEELQGKANVSTQGRYGSQHVAGLLAGRRQYRNDPTSLNELEDDVVCSFADVAAHLIHLYISRE